MGMDWLKELHLPGWVPPELEAHARERRKLKPLPSWKDKVLTNWIATNNVLMRVEERLLTQSEMQAVWKLFKKRGKSDRMVYFVTKATALYLDAAGRYLPDGQKSENDRIDDLRRKVSRQVKNLSETIGKVDEIRGLFEQREPMLKQLAEIQTNLHERLDFTPHKVPARVDLVGKPLQAIRSTRNIGSKGYVETVLKKGIAELFEEVFGKPQAGLARIVSLVMLGAEIREGVGEADRRRTQIYEAKRRRSKQKKK
jgi:hypothetical protein